MCKNMEIHCKHIDFWIFSRLRARPKKVSNSYQMWHQNQPKSDSKTMKKSIRLFLSKFKQNLPIERPMVKKVPRNNERQVRLAAEGSLLMNWKIVLLTKEQVITHASRSEGLASFWLKRGQERSREAKIHVLNYFFLKIILRVSFSPGPDLACRHCWISSFRTPLGKRPLFKNKIL